MQLLTIPPEKQMASKPLPSSVAKSFRGHDKPIHGSAPPSTVPFSLRYSLASLTASFPLKFVTETQKEAGSSSNYHFSGASCLTRWWFQIFLFFNLTWGNVPFWKIPILTSILLRWFGTSRLVFSPNDKACGRPEWVTSIFSKI